MSTQFIFDAIGTHWQIDIFTELSVEMQTRVLEKIKNRIDAFDRIYSRFRSDSSVTKWSQIAGEYELPNDALPLFTLYSDVYQLTSGAFTPLIGQVLVDAGYDAEYSLQEKKEFVLPAGWDAVWEFDDKKIIIKKPAVLDFGAGGKGYLIDLIAAVLQGEGIEQFCVDAGGDIVHHNSMPLKIGLENPVNTEEVVGVVEINHKSLCGSAGNRRAWGAWHHIIDPRTLSPVKNILATWVIADTTLLADVLSTAIFLVSPKIMQEKYSFEYVILYTDFSIEKSVGWKGDFFVA